ncbi:MAG: YsnF/AvaK domain-containing protein [Acidobacteriota bacterium]|nr:YsnF/AvaK domain-containing protein [Acidobacteriota bacterium]
MTHTVIGLFDNKTEARAAMDELVAEGFIRENIDVSDRRFDDSSNVTDTTTGATTGTGVGDSISNFFSSLFGDDQTTAQNYTNAAYDADAILTVQVDSAERASEAAAILDRHGAIDIDARAAQYSGGGGTSQQQNFAQTSGTTENTAATATTAETTIPVIEEELQVGKREVERGGARIRSRVIEKPVEETLRLREEHIVVNRRPVNRAVTDADAQNFQEGDIELTERAEEAVVSKQARVVEEVSVGKEVSEREETVRDTVRRTDVDVEETGGNVTTGSSTTSTTETDDNINTRGATS